MQDLKFQLKEGFELSPSPYREWYSWVRIYFQDVLLRYDFLSHDLDPSLIPNIEDRETGLITIVLSRMVPYDAAKTLHNEFFYEFKKRNRNYTLVEYV